ncbi:hypothetical protein D3C81_1960630 [compost metagenome]
MPAAASGKPCSTSSALISVMRVFTSAVAMSGAGSKALTSKSISPKSGVTKL